VGDARKMPLFAWPDNTAFLKTGFQLSSHCIVVGSTVRRDTIQFQIKVELV
jgi:hypothetical protein